MSVFPLSAKNECHMQSFISVLNDDSSSKNLYYTFLNVHTWVHISRNSVNVYTQAC